MGKTISEKLDIRPKVNVFRLFTRLNYKAYYAIAEFVDNSTASFYSKKKILNFYHIKNVTINITYDEDLNELTIEDDAYGMEIEDFRRAILLGAKPENVNGRNEFGMGLKTAASWFGDVWSVKSTQLGSENEYFAQVNIPFLDENDLNEVNIERSQVKKEKHGTIIKISQLTKSIKSNATKNKIKNHLSSMYRRDLKDNVRILFNGEKLFYKEQNILKFRDTTWEKNIHFNFEYENKNYEIYGKVGILNPGSFSKAGFALFRHNRVIIGGDDENYKPQKIFGQSQSQVSLKLFGEIDMDDFQVNQAKDGFVWDGGLEEKFIDELRANISDYIEIAHLSTKQRMEEESMSDEESDTVQKKVKTFVDKINKIETEKSRTEPQTNIDEFKKQLDEMDGEIIDSPYKDESKPRMYSDINIDKDLSYDFRVKWIEDSNRGDWIQVSKEDNQNIVDISINLNHDFFKPYSNKTDFKVTLEKFVLSFVIAEFQAKETSINDLKLIKANSIRLKMNDLLRKDVDE